MSSLIRIVQVRSWWWALLPALCGLGLAIFLFHLACDQDAWRRGSGWLTYSQWPVFGDLAVTLQHLQQAERGIDPLTDPASQFGYPRAVLALRHLHLQDIPARWLGTLQALLWVASMIFILRPRTAGRALLCAAIFFTPPILLGLERGNMDMLLFVLFVAVAAGWARSRTVSEVFWPAAATALAALLKLYPAFALVGGAWAESGRRRLVWIGAGLAVGTYWLLNLPEIRLVLSKFPVGGGYSSWGCYLALKSLLHASGVEKHFTWAWSISLAVYALGFIALAALGRAHAGKFKGVQISRWDWACYWLGAAICCGTFLTSNYSYRWVFALLTLPVLLSMAAGSRFPAVAWARTALVALTLSLTIPGNGGPVTFFTAQMASWVYILSLVFGCFGLRNHQVELVGSPTRPARRREDDVMTAVGNLVAIKIGDADEPPLLSTCASFLQRRWR